YLVAYILSPKEYAKLSKQLSKGNLELNVSDSAIKSHFRTGTRTFLGGYSLLTVVDAFSLLRSRRSKRAALSKSDILSLLLSRKNAKCAGSLILLIALYQSVLFSERKLLGRIESLLPPSRRLRRLRKRLRATTGLLRSKPITALIAGLVAGLALVIQPDDHRRSIIALYSSIKAMETIINHAKDNGMLNWRPSWLNTQFFFAISTGQLLYTFFFDNDCCPETFSRMMKRFSSGFIPARPPSYSKNLPWPDKDAIISKLSSLPRARYPQFQSPMLSEGKRTIPPVYSDVEPVLRIAHPAITTMYSAITHPFEPSSFKNATEHSLSTLTQVSKLMSIAYGVLYLFRTVVSRQSFSLDQKVQMLLQLIRSSAFASLFLSISWVGGDLSQYILSNNRLPLYRFRLIGFIAGLAGYIDDSKVNRGLYIYTIRSAIYSYWRQLVKYKAVHPLPNGDVLLFAVSLGIIMGVYERSPRAVSSPTARKVLNVIKSGSFSD
ncbi:hypothetical protein CANCADRAFT_19076, partial [Tortispora caseinolytica NRRL Y-17796]